MVLVRTPGYIICFLNFVRFDRHYRDCQATTLHSTASPSTAQATNAVQVTTTSPNIGQVSEDERLKCILKSINFGIKATLAIRGL